MKLEKSRRHEIYKQLLTKVNINIGLCYYISEVCCTKYGFNTNIYKDKTDWPELLAVKPKKINKSKFSGYWWSFTPQGYQARVRAINKMINLSK